MQGAGDRSVWRSWLTAGNRCVLHALLCAALFAPVSAAAEEGKPPSKDPAIPPGEEELLGSMLGRGADLAGCRFTGAQIAYTAISATYVCEGGEVAVELVHPSKAPANAIQTEEFAIMVQSGSPPRSLADALVSRIRAQERDFEWDWPGGPDVDDDDDEE